MGFDTVFQTGQFKGKPFGAFCIGDYNFTLGQGRNLMLLQVYSSMCNVQWVDQFCEFSG